MSDLHKPSPDAISLAQLRLDKQAEGVLSLSRHFLTSFRDPESQAWQMAFATAQERWSETEGPQLAMATLSVLQALRRVRANGIRFANPLCLSCRGWLTPDEADLMSMLQAMRRDRADAARPHLSALTGGRMDPVVVATALALAKKLGPIAPIRPSLIQKSQAQADHTPYAMPTHAGLALVH